MPEMLVHPAIVIFCLVTVMYFGWTTMTALHALWINIAATITAFFFGAVVLYRSLPIEVKAAQPHPTNPAWIRSAVPLMFLAVLQILNAKLDILMLGSMVGTRETGIYSVATRGAGLITYVLVAVNAALGPAIASLNVSQDRQRLQSMITKSSRIVLLISLPACVGLIVFGGFFLRIFGQDFVSGRTALSILCLGQLFSAAMGSVNLLLIMTGHERDALVTLGGSTILNAALNLLLIPRWGIEGAAIASTAGVIMRNAVAALFAYRRLQIHSTALGAIGRSKSS
jgi:O-antigen/teichoic acid export membrane protein